ncbi:MAG: MBL fold metallo-hydrolase [Arcobacter sp.]|nr:MBL fold metallo-hydrolase [Arcobacter sp.]
MTKKINRSGVKVLTISIIFVSFLFQSCTSIKFLDYNDVKNHISKNPKIHFLDVGNGDATIIDIGDKEIIIDGGLNPETLINYLRKTGIIQNPIELMVLTHGDGDHYTGLKKLVENSNYSIIEFWEPGYDKQCECQNFITLITSIFITGYHDFISLLESKKEMKLVRPLELTHPPSTITNEIKQIPKQISPVPEVDITVLHSSRKPESARSSCFCLGSHKCAYLINNSSIVLKIEISGFSFLFTGDINGKLKEDSPDELPIDVEKKLLDNPKIKKALNVDVLKVSHHGSETASTTSFLEAVSPRIAVISASKNILYSLPKETVVKRLENNKAKVYRTDYFRNIQTEDKRLNGHIICEITGNDSLKIYYKNERQRSNLLNEFSNNEK